MNPYEAKIAARKERLEARSEAATSRAHQLATQASRLAEIIPFGQPILVGHHSEGRDRRYRAKISGTFSKACEASREADDLARRAASVGTGGISSDDPDALDKLRVKLAEAEAHHAQMVGVNKIIRANAKVVDPIPKTVQAILDCYPNFSRKLAEVLLQGDCCGRVGYASYQLTNSKGRIKQISERIQQLEEKANLELVEERTEHFVYREDPDENRILFEFPGKPDENIRKALKSYGFRWSPTRCAWATNLTNRGRWSASQIKEMLK